MARKWWYKTGSVQAALVGGIFVVIASLISGISGIALKTTKKQYKNFIVVSSIPEKAEILVDGLVIGRTPDTINVMTNTKLMILKEGFNPIQKLIDDDVIKMQNLDFRLIPYDRALQLSFYSKYDTLINEVEILEKRLRVLESDITTSNNKNSLNIDNNIKEIRLQISELRSTILSDPDKAISLPLIKKDIEQQKDTNRYLSQQIDNIYDLSKWFIGTIVTMIIGLFSLFASIILTNKGISESKNKVSQD